MGNPLDELTGPVETQGRDVNVIAQQIPVTVGFGTTVYQVSIWIVGVLIAFGIGLIASKKPAVALLCAILGLLPGLIFQSMKTHALSYLRKLEQNIQATASQVDNFLVQRVLILENLASLLDKSVDLDKDVMKSVAAFRGGANPNADQKRNETSAGIDGLFSRINVAFEAYPNLKAQDNIAEAMRQNTNLQKEITAARVLYNDTVATWNRDIFDWPTKIIVASKAGYTTRIPFTASQEMKDAARGNFFK
jgi:LemA protein